MLSPLVWYARIKSSLAKPPASVIRFCMSAPRPAATAFTVRPWLRLSLMKKLWRKGQRCRSAIPSWKSSCWKLASKPCGAVAGIQDMGAAGLTCSTCEMAARAGTGIEIDLSLVPQRETGMTAYEMLLSESQERMLIVAHQGREREVADIFRKWDLDAVVIGRVRDDGRMRVTHNGEVVCDVPVKSLTDEAPIYERPLKAGSADVSSANASTARVSLLPQETANESPVRAGALTADETSAFPATTAPQNFNDALLRLLSAPNLASKEWVYRQYDHMVRTNTVVLPGADAAVVRIKETRRALAIALDGNGRYCAANPRAGAKLIVAEAARNVVCVGAQPIAITNCLNFAS